MCAAQADRPQTSDPAVAELRGRVEALESKPPSAPPGAAPAAPSAEADKDIAALKAEIASLRTALQSLDGSVDKIKAAATASGAGEQKAVAAARASAAIGVAARLNTALQSGQPQSGIRSNAPALVNDLGNARHGDAKIERQPVHAEAQRFP